MMSAFFLVVVTLSILGWRWAAGLPSPKLESARAVLAISALAAAGGIAVIWSAKSRSSESH